MSKFTTPAHLKFFSAEGIAAAFSRWGDIAESPVEGMPKINPIVDLFQQHSYCSSSGLVLI